MSLFFGQNQESGFGDVKYGYLYNWYLASDPSLTAVGWEVPTNTQWTTLTNYLGGLAVSGGKLKEVGLTHWTTPNTGATNEVAFNSRGSGLRRDNGSFILLLQYETFWTSTPYNSPLAYYRQIEYNTTAVISNNNANRGGGYSIRLLKSSTTLLHGETGTYTGNDGRIYPTICIGSQEWMSVNLAETQYRNTTPFPKVTDGTTWDALNADGYCAYDNDENNV